MGLCFEQTATSGKSFDDISNARAAALAGTTNTKDVGSICARDAMRITHSASETARGQRSGQFSLEPLRGLRQSLFPSSLPRHPMRTLASSSSRAAAVLSTDQLRAEFLAAGLFVPGAANLLGWETDRTIMGAISPLATPLSLPNPAEVRSAFFLERREAGVINLGGPGSITVDGTTHAMESLDALYLGRGAKDVAFASRDPAQPARFYLLSYPAHTAHPVRHVPIKDAKPDRLGARETANERLLYKLIHPGAFPSCQLVMGFTRLEPGSVWNTMPPHTHPRRSEVYCYFNVPANGAVFHFMGEPTATRHLVVRDLEIALSPPWSIHCGCGTAAYAFVWGMGGENQEFSDMDPAPVAGLR